MALSAGNAVGVVQRTCSRCLFLIFPHKAPAGLGARGGNLVRMMLLPVLVILAVAPAAVYAITVPMKTITIMELLLSPKDAPLPPGVLEISLGNLKGAVSLPENIQDIKWTGRGSVFPPWLLAEHWSEDPFGDDRLQPAMPAMPAWVSDLPPSLPPLLPLPPSQPQVPPPPPTPPYTVMDSRYLLHPTIHLLPNQSMSMKSMGVYSASIPVRGQELSQLELDLIKVSVGAELQLEDVTFVVGCNELDLLLQTLCTNTRTWPYDPTGAVTVEGGIMHIRNLTSRVPGEDKDSTPGAGGEVRWSNVTIMCPVADRPARKACVARAVSSGSELYAAARKALVEEEGNTVLLSITGDVALPTDGSWVTIPLRPDQQLVLLGDPTRPSTSTIQLDLSGIPDAWSIQQPENSNPTACEGPRRTSRPVALLYDLLLVNLPYPTEPQGPMSLLAASLPCFTVVRGVLWSEGATQLSLTRSTIVVPDRELIFLAAAVGRNSSDVWPGQPQGGFLITVEKSQQQVPEPSATAREFRGSSDPPGRLSVQELKLLSEVLLTDCVLMSTSSYQQLPGAVPLTPQSLTWLPELLEANDLETVNRWGHGGLAIFPGLQQALEDLVSCGVRDGYNPVRLIWRQDDTSIPQLDAICNSTAIMPAAASTTVRGPAADTCIVDGSSSASSVTTRQGMTTTRQKERGPRRHAFSDLQGAVSRIALARPITLRNLVLYNLAPGGAYPVAVTAQQEGSSLPSLRPSDVAWANSALPLWFFEFVRSTEADVSCQLTEENYSKIATKSTDVHTAAAANFTDNNNLLQQQHTTSCPLIFLENVTLVVPEPEWQALVAAVLMVHYPEVFWQKAAPAGREPTSSDQGAAGAAGDSSTPTTLKSKLAESGVASTLVGSVEDTIASIGGLPGSPSPPSPPHSPPSSPDNADTTRAALLGFATASQVLSYNHSSGELVLKVARHYGWIGSTVTITHKLPADAPDSAKLLTYPNLSFPHQDDDDDFKLAGVDIDLWIESSPSQPPPAGGTPPYSPLAAKTRIDQDPDSSTKERAVGSVQGPSSSGDATPPVAAGAPPQLWIAVSHPDGPHATSLNRRPSWLVPVAVSMSVFGSILVVVSLIAGIGLLSSQQRQSCCDPSARDNTGSTSSHKRRYLHAYHRWYAHFLNGVAALCGTAAAARQRRQQQQQQQQQQRKPEIVVVTCNGRSITTANAATAGGAAAADCRGCSPSSAASAEHRQQDSLSSTAFGMMPTPAAGTDASSANANSRGGTTTTAEANRAAMAQALLERRTALLLAASSGAAPTAAGSRLRAELKSKCNTNGCDGSSGDCGSGYGSQGSQNPQYGSRTAVSAVQPYLDHQQVFLMELNAYYNDKIGNLRSGSSHDHQAVDEVWKVDSSKSSAALVVPRRHRGPRSMSDAIKAIHAELRDAELRLDYVIGSGASGAVYSGVWRGLPVAVKTRVVVTDLHEAKEGRVRQQAAAVLEAAISLSMSHPNVVVTYSYDVKPLVHAPSEADDGTGTQQSGSDDAAAGAAAGAAAAAAAAGSSRDAAERCAAQLGTCDVMKLYIVQEYCNGGTLRKALNQGMAGCVRAGGCARMLAVRLALDVAGGMAHIHSCRIVHGDLKPENVLLTLTSLRPDSRSRTDFASLTSASALATAGGGKAAVGLSAPAIPVDSSTSSGSAVAASLPVPVSAKVADFGLSTRLAEGATHVSGCFQGTTTYLAPEVVGKGQLSPGADIWAFGLILVELYYGCSFQDVETAYSAAAPMGSSSENYAVDYSLGTKSHAQAFLEDILASMADRSYAALAEGCLAAPPQERPSFRELAAALRTLAEEQQQQQ